MFQSSRQGMEILQNASEATIKHKKTLSYFIVTGSHIDRSQICTWWHRFIELEV